MAIQVSWYAKEQIIRWKFRGDIKIDDIQGAEIETYLMMQKSRSDAIHVIFDVKDAKRLPSFISARKVKWVLPGYKKNAINVVVGLKNPMLNFVLSAGYKNSKTQLKLVSTFTEAFQYLQSEDKSLLNLYFHQEPDALSA